MTLTVADILRWDPQALRDVAAAAATRAESAEQAARVLAVLPVLAQWDGLAASAARLTITVTMAELGDHALEARAVARAAGDGAEAVAAVKADLRALEDTAHAGSIDIDHDSGTVVAGAGFHGGPADIEAVASRLARILDNADCVDAELMQAITRASSRDKASSEPRYPPGLETDVRKWWASLSGAERSALISADPQRFGSRNGIPVADRDGANRITMAADLDRMTAAATGHDVTVAEVLADPERYGLTADQKARYTNAVQVAEGLSTAVMRTGAPALLWIYEPGAFGGQGRAAIAVGDPDRADDTAVVVPGTGNSVASGWLGENTATNLFNELALAEPGVSHSVIGWMGFDTPDSMADLRVAQPGLARRGAVLLAADMRALAATHLGRAGHVTAIGHSYGSTTVADAAAGAGMRVDDVVLVGCPGTDLARTAADFHLPRDGHVYVGSASADPVNLIAGLRGEVGLGADPAADGFGSTRFKAEVPGRNWNPVAEHIGYFADGSESLYSIADIASGHGELLQEHGMTAPHRTAALGALATRLGMPSWSIPFTDPELGRAATSGNRH